MARSRHPRPHPSAPARERRPPHAGTNAFRYRSLPWWTVALLLPALVGVAALDTGTPAGEAGIGGLWIALLVLAVLAAFTFSASQQLGVTGWRRISHTAVLAVFWSIALAFLLTLPIAAGRLLWGADSRQLNDLAEAPVVALAWPVVASVVVFVGTTLGWGISSLRFGLSSGDGQTGWPGRALAIGLGAILLGAFLVGFDELVDAMGDHQITANGRAVPIAVLQGLQATGATGWIMRLAVVLFVGGLATWAVVAQFARAEPRATDSDHPA